MTTITFREDTQEADESLRRVLDMTEGEERVFSCVFWGVPSGVGFKAYRSPSGGRGVEVNIFNGSTASISGKTATLPKIFNLTGNAMYVIEVTATVSGEKYTRLVRFNVRQKGTI